MKIPNLSRHTKSALHLLRNANRRHVGYVGATTFTSDARCVFTRWRRGEGLQEGPHIYEFERALSKYYGGLDVTTFGAGRMALYAILKAMNLKEGDEIILPGYTCIVTSNAIRHAGLVPVYVDISFKDFNLITDLTVKAITSRTRAILAQHTFGIPCDMDALLEISSKYGLPIIEDGAHAIGARWNGQLVGRLGYAAFFSTQLTKMFSTGRGGFTVTKDRQLAGRIRDIAQQSPYRPLKQERACLLRWCYYAALRNKPSLAPRLELLDLIIKKVRIPILCDILEYDRIDYASALEGRVAEHYPCRLPNLMAYAGLLQLRRLEEDLAHRRNLARYLMTRLPLLGAKVPAYDTARASPSWIRFPFVVQNRDKWMCKLRKSGFTPGVWLNDPIHPKGSNWEKAGYTRGSCPNAEYLSKHILNLPVDSRVTIAKLAAC